MEPQLPVGVVRTDKKASAGYRYNSANCQRDVKQLPELQDQRNDFLQLRYFHFSTGVDRQTILNPEAQRGVHSEIRPMSTAATPKATQTAEVGGADLFHLPMC